MNTIVSAQPNWSCPQRELQFIYEYIVDYFAVSLDLKIIKCCSEFEPDQHLLIFRSRLTAKESTMYM